MNIYEFKLEHEIDYIEQQLRKESTRTLFFAAVVFLLVYGISFVVKGPVMFKWMLGITIFYLVVGNFYFKDFYNYAAKRNKIISRINWVEGRGMEVFTLPSRFIVDFKPKVISLLKIVEIKEYPDFIYSKRENESRILEGFSVGRCFRIETLTEYYYLIFDADKTESEIQMLIDTLSQKAK